MKTRIIHTQDSEKLRDVWVVQKWARQLWNDIPTPRWTEDWEFVRMFELNEYEKACIFAMHLSQDKNPVEKVIFDGGQQLFPPKQFESCLHREGRLATGEPWGGVSSAATD